MPKRDIVIEHVLCDARRKRICMYIIALRGDSMRYSICTFLRYKATSSKVQMKVKFNNENSVFCLFVCNRISFLPHFLPILPIVIHAFRIIISLKLIFYESFYLWILFRQRIEKFIFLEKFLICTVWLWALIHIAMFVEF